MTQTTNATFKDILLKTGPVDEGHFFFTPQFHSRYNILLQLCFQDYKNRSDIGREMYFAVNDLDPTIILAVNSSLAYLLAQEVGERLGGPRQTIHGHRRGGFFALPRFFHIGSGDRVLIVDDGIVTGTGCTQAVETVVSAGAKCIGLVAAYSRYPRGVKDLSARLGVEVRILSDLSNVYPIVPAGQQTCEQCRELQEVEAELKEHKSDRDENELALRKAQLLLKSAYEQTWGYEYGSAP